MRIALLANALGVFLNLLSVFGIFVQLPAFLLASVSISVSETVRLGTVMVDFGVEGAFRVEMGASVLL